jgi:PhnB protein
MALNAYLLFNGNCAEAFKFYEKLLGGKIIQMQTHGESPEASKTPPGQKDKILHVHMTIGNDVLMGSDAPPEHFEKPQGFSMTFAPSNPADGERIFNALADKGTVKMPYQATFWAAGFGMCVDRFGIPWMVNVAK